MNVKSTNLGALLESALDHHHDPSTEAAIEKEEEKEENVGKPLLGEAAKELDELDQPRLVLRRKAHYVHGIHDQDSRPRAPVPELWTWRPSRRVGRPARPV